MRKRMTFCIWKLNKLKLPLRSCIHWEYLICLLLFIGIANPAVFKQPQGKLPDTFILIWEVDSFSPIFEYKILLRKKEDTNWISFIIPADSSSSGPLHSKSYTLSGLERLPQYEAKIISRNRFGWSESSKVVTFGFTKSISAEGIEYS